MIYRVFFSWIGEDLSVYDEDKDLREVDIPVIKNMVKGYAAYVISHLCPSLQNVVLILRYGSLYSDETRPWNKKTFTDHFKLEGLGPTVCNFLC